MNVAQVRRLWPKCNGAAGEGRGRAPSHSRADLAARPRLSGLAVFDCDPHVGSAEFLATQRDPRLRKKCSILLAKVLTPALGRDYIPVIRRAVRYTVRLRASEAPH
jgi:hypothetical protein